MIKAEANSPVTDHGLLNFGQINYELGATSLGVPVVTLSNMVRVANFSSPHTFTFTDGTVLPACSPERARTLALEAQEYECDNFSDSGVKFVDLVLSWEMSAAVRTELLNLSKQRGYDILLVPLPVMTAIKATGLPIGRCRCIRSADRVKKLAHIDRFCI